MDCKTPTSIDKVTQFGKQHKCNCCHSSYRYCTKNVKDWKSLTAEPWTKLQSHHTWVHTCIWQHWSDYAKHLLDSTLLDTQLSYEWSGNPRKKSARQSSRIATVEVEAKSANFKPLKRFLACNQPWTLQTTPHIITSCVRKVQSSESRALEGDADYLNEIRFRKRGKKWYDWNDQECSDRWNEFMRDPTVPKGKDQFLSWISVMSFNE